MGIVSEAYKELRTRYTNGWSPIPTEFQNEKFEKPKKSPWARFLFFSGLERQLDIGDTKKTFRLNGQLVVQMYTPSEFGSIDILNKSDTVASIFRNWCGHTVRCYGASVNPIGNDQFGFYQVNVVIEFKVDTLI